MPNKGNNNASSGSGSGSFRSGSTNKGGIAASGTPHVVAIRFTPGDDSVEDVTRHYSGRSGESTTTTSSSSLSSSPAAAAGLHLPSSGDDSSWRKLHGGFFSRKRAGSIEALSSNTNTTTTTTSSNNNNNSPNTIATTATTTYANSTSSSSSIMSTSTASESGGGGSSMSSPSLGTWKLIKGKVSQAMEDITSPKQSSSSSTQQQQQQQQQQPTTTTTTHPFETPGGDDSDADDSATLNSSISDDFNEAAARTGGGGGSGIGIVGVRWLRGSNNDGSDSDADLLDISHDSDAYVMKKSFDALRQATTSSNTSPTPPLTTTTTSATTSKQRSTSGGGLFSKLGRRTGGGVAEATAEWPNALRRRHHHRHNTNNSNRTDGLTIDEHDTNSGSSSNKNNNIDIESGVEITEEMTLPMHSVPLSNSNNNHDDNNSPTTTATPLTSFDNRRLAKNRQSDSDDCDHFVDVLDDDLLTTKSNVHRNNDRRPNTMWMQHLRQLPNKRQILTYITLMCVCWFWNVPAFIQGMLACLCSMSLAQTVWQLFVAYLAQYVNERLLGTTTSATATMSSAQGSSSSSRHGPERGAFVVPDYARMGPLQMPIDDDTLAAAHVVVPVEHKAFKSYEGWMSTANTYDPCNFHQSQARSVYIRLDGTTLRISPPSAGCRVPKRAVFNAPVIPPPILGNHRRYELLGCSVEMIPRGLARKRHFSRKYPIQVVVKCGEEIVGGAAAAASTSAASGLLRLGSPVEAAPITIGISTATTNTATSTSSITTDRTNNSNEMTAAAAHEEHQQQRLIGGDDERNFGDMIMYSDLQRLHHDDHFHLAAAASSSSSSSPSNQKFNQKTSPSTTTTTTATTSGTLPLQHQSRANEVHLWLFARTDREKEDWYRRFVAASQGLVADCQPSPLDGGFTSDMVFVNEDDCGGAAEVPTVVSDSDAAAASANHSSTRSSVADDGSEAATTTNYGIVDDVLLMSASAARGPPDYVRFMGHYQRAVVRSGASASASSNGRQRHDRRGLMTAVSTASTSPLVGEKKRSRREQKKIQETADDLWRGVDRTLVLTDASAGGLLWTNILVGRLLFSCLNDTSLIGHIQALLQRKLSAIKLPGFMEEVRIAHVHLGDCPPLIHRVATPRLDERGTWIDADVTYEGLMHMTITTKLNLLRLRRQQQQHQQADGGGSAADGKSSGEVPGNITSTTSATMSTNTTTNITSTGYAASTITATSSSSSPIITVDTVGSNGSDIIGSPPESTNTTNTTTTTTSKKIPVVAPRRQVEALFDSDAESSGASSSDSEGSCYAPMSGNNLKSPQDVSPISSGGGGGGGIEASSSSSGGKKFLRIVDRIAASNLFQSAAEISYIQKAMENMSTAIKLRVELKAMVARCCINLPPPPSDRVWLGFRGPPRLWLSATPALGDHTVDWSIVTSAIESKLCDELTKYLVYPNMVDLIVPQLGSATYKPQGTQTPATTAQQQHQETR